MLGGAFVVKFLKWEPETDVWEQEGEEGPPIPFRLFLPLSRPFPTASSSASKHRYILSAAKVDVMWPEGEEDGQCKTRR